MACPSISASRSRPFFSARWQRNGFRNLAPAEIALSPSATVLEGPNGQGKTNFLEACYLLCTLRPLRAQKLAELVRFGAESATSHRRDSRCGAASGRSKSRSAQGRRSARLDGKPLRDPDELFNELAVVAFTPGTIFRWCARGRTGGGGCSIERCAEPASCAARRCPRLSARASRAAMSCSGKARPMRCGEAFDEPLASWPARESGCGA